ncbi:MAG: amino acid ABC transporter permease [Chloroflexota bacterium]
MATTMGVTPDPLDRAVVNYDEPPIKPPPVLAVGPLAWIHENLFKSAFDTILTVVAALGFGAALVGILKWAISDANWFVITNNLRLLMVGTFPVDAQWRLDWSALLCAFVVGVTLFAYTRVSRSLVIILVAVVALLFIAPVVVQMSAPPVVAYAAAGETSIVSGSVSEAPQNAVSFLARAGERVTVSLATINDDQELAGITGFQDRATSAAVNAAKNRLTAQQQRAELENRLNTGLLTSAQLAELRNQLSATQIPDTVTETYALNSASVDVAVLDGATFEILASASLTADSAPLSLTLPTDGWYVLQKTSASNAILATTGIYPHYENSFTRVIENARNISVTQYVRTSDGFSTDAARPTTNLDGERISAKVVIDNQYQGTRPFSDYLVLFVAPFFRTLSLPFLQLLIAGTVGYWMGRGLAGVLPHTGTSTLHDRRKRVRGAVSLLWLVWLIALFVLTYGIEGLDALGVGLLLSRFVWIGWMYFVGMNLDRTWGRPLLALVILLGVAEAVLGEGLLDRINAALSGQNFAALVVPLVSVLIWLGVGVYAARRGRSASARWGERRLRALMIFGAAWLILFLAPPLLLSAAGTTENVLPLSDTRRWGGFLLTALLTIVGILASFPLGVLLALGRRSNLPVVRWTCVTFIELVRGVPFITVLFMAQLLVPLVDAALAEVDNVFRAMVGVVLFSAAYLAENVRGGLQSIPGGQEEAAKALGLNGFQVTLLITLPQALRVVIPALVGQAIALFKDTTLVALVGLTDLLNTTNAIIAQAEYVGLRAEGYFFISIIYFGFSYLMAWVSRRIEFSGSGAARRV